jgi:hypothetical protein
MEIRGRGEASRNSAPCTFGLLHHRPGGLDGVARPADTSHGTGGTVLAPHDRRIHFLHAGAGEHGATARVELRVVLQGHHSGGHPIRGRAAGRQHLMPGLQAISQAGVVLGLCLWRHRLWPHRAGATVDGEGESLHHALFRRMTRFDPSLHPCR